MGEGCGCTHKPAAEFSPVWASEPTAGLSFLLLDLNLLCLNLLKAQRNCWTPTYLLVGEFTGLFMLGKFPRTSMPAVAYASVKLLSLVPSKK